MLAGGGTVAAFLLGSQGFPRVQAVPAPGINNTQEPGSAAISEDYVVYKDGSSFLIKNGASGGNDSSWSTAPLAVANAITALGSNEGTIVVKAGVGLTLAQYLALTIPDNVLLVFEHDTFSPQPGVPTPTKNFHSLYANMTGTAAQESVLDVEATENAVSGAKVAGYFAMRAKGSSPIWALNPLIQIEATANGSGNCIEADVNNFSVTSVDIHALEITGASTQQSSGDFVGVNVDSPSASPFSTPWKKAIKVVKSWGVGGNGVALYMAPVDDTSPTSAAIALANAALSINKWILSKAGIISAYNGTPTVDLGHPVLYARYVNGGLTGAVTNAINYVPPATSGFYRLTVFVNVDAWTTPASFTVTVTYKDNNGTARSDNITFSRGSSAGTMAGAITAIDRWNGIPMSFLIDGSATAITVSSSGTFTGSPHYAMGIELEQLQ